MQAVDNKKALIKILHSYEHEIRAYGVNNVELFGSFLTDEINDKSDVDLLVDFNTGQKTFDNLMDLGFFLEDILGRKVEIVTPQSLNKYIGPHILNQVENVIG